jgi:hypothetical protein
VALNLSPASLPPEVDEVALQGFDAENVLLLELSDSPSPQLEIEGVPSAATDLVVEYKTMGRTVALSEIRLPAPVDGVRTVASPPVIPLAQALQGLSVDAPSFEIPQDTVVLVKSFGLTVANRSLNLRRSALWASSNPSVATVREGLVRGVSPGTATVYARIGGHIVETAITVTGPVQNASDLTIPSDGRTHTLDLERGELDRFPVPGWDPTTRTFIVANFVVESGATLELQAGSEFVLSAIEGIRIDGFADFKGRVSFSAKYPQYDEGNAGFDAFFFAQEDVAINGGYTAIGDGESITSDFSGPGGDLTILTDGNISLTSGVDCSGGAGSRYIPTGRGGNILMECQGTFTASAPLKVSAGQSGAVSGGIAGDLVIRSQGQMTCTNDSSLEAQGGPNFFGQGGGGRGGRIALASATGITLQSTVLAQGGEVTSEDATRSAGMGGQISLISSGPLLAPGRLDVSGGASTGGLESSGPTAAGQGGTIRVFAASGTVGTASVEGGSSNGAAGGAGGKIVTSESVTITTPQLAGGTGNPAGASGTTSIVGNRLEISDGTHNFSTDSGEYDGLPLPGWDPITSTLTLELFELGTAATLNITGATPFNCQALQSIDVSGTLSFPGLLAVAPAVPTPGGDIVLTSVATSVGPNGLVESPGGPSDFNAAPGGLVSLTGDTVDIAGTVAAIGGESSLEVSGQGGQITVNGQTKITHTGTLNATGGVGFSFSGRGGTINVTTPGELDSSGAMVASGGASGSDSAQGGSVTVQVGGDAETGGITCNGGLTGGSAGRGGAINFTAQGDISVNGFVSATGGLLSTTPFGAGGSISITGGQGIAVNSSGAVRADGRPGGSVVINAALSVTAFAVDSISADSNGTVSITPPLTP